MALEDLVGQVFGRLTVTSLKEAGKGNRIWNCICSCGNTTLVPTNYLKASRVRSCGCLVKEHASNLNRLPPKEGSLNRVYKAYKKRATNKNLDFKLSKRQFLELISQPCHYCGHPGRSNTSTVNPQGYDHFDYNGLDRIDSKLGYALDNVVTCCSICNHAKHVMAYEEFITYLRELASRWNTIEDHLHL